MKISLKKWIRTATMSIAIPSLFVLGMFVGLNSEPPQEPVQHAQALAVSQHTLAATETKHPACEFLDEIAKQSSNINPAVKMRVGACLIPPATNGLVFYVTEIMIEENGRHVSYGWLLGEARLIDGEWALTSEPEAIEMHDYSAQPQSGSGQESEQPLYEL